MNNKLERVLKLKEMYDTGLIPEPAKHVIAPDLLLGDRINYVFFTLPTSLNFQRSSPAMWNSAFETFQDPQTNYLFYPEQVVKTPYRKVQSDLVKHKLALQYNKHTDIWVKLSTTLHEQYESDPRKIIEEGENCVIKIRNILQVEKKKSFPYISGEKISNYWLFILSNFTDVKFQNPEKITVIPDTHVIQSSVKLGIVDEKATPTMIADAWDELLDGSGVTAAQMHSVLWNWSRNGFRPEV